MTKVHVWERWLSVPLLKSLEALSYCRVACNDVR
jgi:hypothetical protein